MEIENVTFRRHRSVLIGKVVGDINLERVLAIRAAQVAHWNERLPIATVMDYRASRSLLSAKEWEFAFQAGLRWTYDITKPTGFVLREDAVPSYMAHATRWADHGVVMNVFTELSDALAWASRRSLARLRHCAPGRQVQPAEVEAPAPRVITFPSGPSRAA